MMKSPLREFDYQKLDASWISREIVDDAGIFRVDSHEGAQLVGRPNKRDYAGIVFPYFWPGESQLSYFRFSSISLSNLKISIKWLDFQISHFPR